MGYLPSIKHHPGLYQIFPATHLNNLHPLPTRQASNGNGLDNPEPMSGTSILEAPWTGSAPRVNSTVVLQPVTAILMTLHVGVCLGEARRWHRIYATVFPGSDPPRSQYLDKGCGKAVSMTRDFWRAKGQCSVSKFLESRKMLGEQEVENDAQDELCKLVLEDTLQEIVKRHGGS